MADQAHHHPCAQPSDAMSLNESPEQPPNGWARSIRGQA